MGLPGDMVLMARRMGFSECSCGTQRSGQFSGLTQYIQSLQDAHLSVCHGTDGILTLVGTSTLSPWCGSHRHLFSVAAVTNCHKPGSLKTAGIVLTFWRQEF